jgi:hypothetical protein
MRLHRAANREVRPMTTYLLATAATAAKGLALRVLDRIAPIPQPVPQSAYAPIELPAFDVNADRPASPHLGATDMYKY